MHCISLWLLVIISLQLSTPLHGNELQSMNGTTNATDEMPTKVINFERGYCGNQFSAPDDIHHGCIYHNHTVQCYGSDLDLQRIKLHRGHHVRQIIFCRWQNETFDPRFLTKFVKLKAFHMEYGEIKYMINDFPELLHLQAINISFTRLAYIKTTVFRHLPALESIDLRYNQFDHIDRSFVLHPNPTQRHPNIFLSENPWNCANSFKWLMNYTKTKHIIDRESMQCSDIRFKNQSILTVMNFKWTVRDLCYNNTELRNCSCSLAYITLDLEEVWRPIYSINCSNLHFFQLPASVPENTTTFYAKNNHISNIEPIISSAYSSVQDIYLDHNEISSIEVLESDGWLERFRAFSLKGNLLNKLPVYLLNNALERNHQASALYLSENPWHCECVFTSRFQELLQRHRELIKDVNDIRCVYTDDDGNILKSSVLALKRHDICEIDDPAIKPIDLLNILLAILIIFIVSKLSYDYYYYRRSGRLPWIVTKMP